MRTQQKNRQNSLLDTSLHTVNKHMKGCSTSHVIIKLQIQTTMRRHGKKKKKKIQTLMKPNVGEGMEQ